VSPTGITASKKTPELSSDEYSTLLFSRLIHLSLDSGRCGAPDLQRRKD